MKKATISFLFGLLSPFIAHAHVGYLMEESEFINQSGRDWTFFFSPLEQSSNLILILFAIALVFLVVFLAHHNHRFHMFEQRVVARALTYDKFVPWMLRLSLGIALIGAGTQQALISPLLPEMMAFSFIQTFVGFFVLAGFLLGPSILVAIALYVVALLANGYLIGNLDVLALTIALLVYADNRPGVDHLFGIPFMVGLKKLTRFVPFILRTGMGFAMIYSALIEKVLNPHTSATVINEYGLTSVIAVSPAMWVFAVGAIELVVGLLLLFGFWTRTIAIITFFILSVTFFYFGEDVYSHVTLFGTLSALVALGGGAWSIDHWIHKKKVARH